MIISRCSLLTGKEKFCFRLTFVNVFKKYILYANLMGRAQANTTDILKVPEMHRFALS